MTPPSNEERLEALRLSAKGCGLFPHKAVVLKDGRVMFAAKGKGEWNPPENPAQDRECLEQLRLRGWTVAYSGDSKKPNEAWMPKSLRSEDWIIRDCEWKDFACLALAEVVRREK